MADKEKNAPSGSQAVSGAERALDVIELLVDHPRGVRLTDIARKLGLVKSATHRLLNGLVRRGYAEHLSGPESYRLSLKIATLGLRQVAQTGVLELCQPILDRLASATGELSLLALFGEDDLTFVAKARGSRRGLRFDADLGWEAVLHATATGRAWLMTLPDENAVERVETNGFGVPKRYGPQKITNSAELVGELARSRERGYGFSVDEGALGAACIAMPLLADTRGNCAGAISVAGSVPRITVAVDTILPHLKTAIAQMSTVWPVIESRMTEF